VNLFLLFPLYPLHPRKTKDDSHSPQTRAAPRVS
jgi:hypothetical protein